MKYKRVTWLRFLVGMAVFLPLFGFMLALQLGAIQNYEVTSGSMEPTLQVGDRVFMDRIEGYMPKRGDVIVLENPDQAEELITKRVIALPGDKVEIRNGYVYLNGKEQIEMYVLPENMDIPDSPDAPGSDRKWTIESEHVFVLGDNRKNSYDSRIFGQIPISRIHGKLTWIYWPLNRFGEVH